MKSVQIRTYFWSIFSCIWTEYRKIRTRNNTIFGHFSRSGYLNNYFLNFLVFTFLLFKHAIKCVSDQYNTEEICDKAIDTYAHALKFVSDCFKTQKMCNNVVNTYFFCNTIRSSIL